MVGWKVTAATQSDFRPIRMTISNGIDQLTGDPAAARQWSDAQMNQSDAVMSEAEGGEPQHAIVTYGREDLTARGIVSRRRLRQEPQCLALRVSKGNHSLQDLIALVACHDNPDGSTFSRVKRHPHPRVR